MATAAAPATSPHAVGSKLAKKPPKLGIVIFGLAMVVGVIYSLVHLLSDLSGVHPTTAYPFVLLGVALAIVFSYAARNRFHLASDRAGRARWRVFRQPHVDIRKVLKVFGKELRLQRREHDTARYQQNKRCPQADLPVFNGLLCCSEIPAREPTLPSFLD